MVTFGIPRECPGSQRRMAVAHDDTLFSSATIRRTFISALDSFDIF